MLNGSRLSITPALGVVIAVAALSLGACIPAGSTDSGTEVAVAQKEPTPAKEALASSGAGRDWPMFGGSIERNLANPVEKDILDSFSVTKGKEKNVKWKAVLGSYAYGGPVIAGGRVFVGTNNAKPRDPKIEGDKGVLVCLRESDGSFLWQIVHDKLDNGAIDAEYCGIASTPAVDGDRLYYVSNRCELVCADIKGDPNNPGKGKIIWSLDMIKDLKVYPGGIEGGLANCSPLVLEELVYVVTSNGVSQEQKPPSPDAPSFLAVDKKSGKPVWQSNLPGKNILDGQWGNPVAAEVRGKKQVIFPGGDGWLYAFEAKSGDLLWKFDCNPKDSSFKKGSRNYLIATPVVSEGKLYVGVGREPDQGTGVGHLWCIDITKEPQNKDKDLSPANDKFDPKDPANKDSGLVWHFGGKIMGDPVRDYAFGRTMSSVVVHDGLAYAVDLDGFFNCFDAKTGALLWNHDMSGGTWASPSYINGKVYIGIDGGELFIFEAGRAKKAPVKIATGADLRVPVVAAHGVLYINRADFLFAIAAK